MDLNNINKIVELMSEHGLNEFEMEEDGKRISIKKGLPVAQTAPVVLPQTAPVPPDEPAPSPAPADDADVTDITAPFVGTFYSASSPDAPPFVSVGQEVEADTVMCVLEAMKVMNEIKAEVRGVVKEILVKNAEPVQYGQPLFRVRKI